VIPRFLLSAGIEAAERGLVPDAVIRRSMRALCEGWAREQEALPAAERGRRRTEFARAASSGPIAPVPAAANEQHYEVPAAFFDLVLGARRKYSSCHFGPETGDPALPPAARLDAAEESALARTAEHADLANGQRVLELGCGWGSLTLWMAERFPASRITAVSNSASQRLHIEGRAKETGLRNVRVITADMNGFAPDGRFDRVVSVEMFEHMRNWRELLARIAGWLEADGRLFLHFFCHRSESSVYGTEGPENWMGRHFFTGGIMPARDLLAAYEADLAVEADWWWNGRHYRDTAEAWLANLDARRAEAMPVLAETYGPRDAERWFHRWRLFFLSCAELFGLREGEEWGVGHYRLAPVSAAAVQPR
jgi:cyclopropane-fatty-acyl-phospholipid synthase